MEHPTNAYPSESYAKNAFDTISSTHIVSSCPTPLPRAGINPHRLGVLSTETATQLAAETEPYTTRGSDRSASFREARPVAVNPLFTLIEDSETGEHHHPTVHYIFDDDDPELLTAASMRSLGVELASSVREDEGSNQIMKAPIPPSQPGVRERYLLVDLGADGHTTKSAHSLSADWQITSTDITNAPTWDGEDSAAATDGGLMLKIVGAKTFNYDSDNRDGRDNRINAPVASEEARRTQGGALIPGMTHIVDQLTARMQVLEAVFHGQLEIEDTRIH